MAGQFQAPKGVPDYFPPRSNSFLAVQNAIGHAATLAGYGYVELPVFEDVNLFVRGIGESTDVVSKEMYVFEDRGGRTLALRPEGTAGVARLVIEHGLDKGQLPVKLWYQGPFFRAERPQQGRYRQLQQVGIEAIGAPDPALDVEVISVADDAFRSLGLRNFNLMLTSLGCANCRPEYKEKLIAYLEKLDLDEETKTRGKLNPLRVLDDKRPEVQKLLDKAPLMINELCDACANYHREVEDLLEATDVKFTPAPKLVRGLDYYTRTTFEFDHPGLGAQSGIGGGGRYDGLMSSLGGNDLSGIGFGIGTDRTLMACEAENLIVGEKSLIDVFIVPIGDRAHQLAVSLLQQIRAANLRADMAYGDRGLKGAMKAADKSGAQIAVVIGDEEVSNSRVQIKNLGDSSQVQVALGDMVAHLIQVIRQTEQS
ncbi:MAG: histidine--tRNA ligase [Actinomycetota bacterium]|nr:histidine--tRNA ligase [Actinomycetota bacterium]MDA3025985.1 histidine--tRNA ligase [Actinomycetota bacterium]